MQKLIFAVMFLLAGVPTTQQTNPVPSDDAPPVFSFSQRDALFFLEASRSELEKQRQPLRVQLENLDGRLVSVAESEKAIAAEYAQQHPG
jgi:hypothetical protein